MPRDFGFTSPRRLVFDEISGAPDNGILHEQTIADSTANRVGFHSREPAERVPRVRKPSLPHDHAFVRAPIEVINRYKRYCNETGLNYGEALDELMRRAGY